MRNTILLKMSKHLPHFASGEIVHGFGRGSRELGIPTANFALEVVKSLPQELETGIYFGWASVENGPVHKMVMSVGWNPFYDNKEKSMETHIIHDFGADLYGKLLKVCLVGYLRPEKNFDSLETLVEAINNDINQSREFLEMEEFKKYKDSNFFKECNNNNNNNKLNGS